MTIFTVRTTARREKAVAEAIEGNVKAKGLEVYAVLNIPEIKGYIFVEAKDIEEAQKALKDIPHVRGILDKEVSAESLKGFLEEKEELILFNEGDLVEVIGGPFKREKAKIVSIDASKKEARIELIESAVPIPITIKLELLRKLR